jgi:hypothetical protein
VDHTFLFAIREKQGFNPEIIDWIKVLHKNGDPISAYLFILVIEVFFTMVKLNPEINGIEIFDFNPLMLMTQPFSSKTRNLQSKF